MATMGGKQTRAKRARRQFTDEFRAGAVRLVLTEGKTVAQVARDIDLSNRCTNPSPQPCAAQLARDHRVLMTSTAETWKERVASWRASGQTAEAFSRGQPWSAATLRW